MGVPVVRLNVPALDLVNSEWYDGHGRLDDRLRTGGWLEAFVRRWGWETAGPPGPATLRGFGELRTALRRLIEAVASGGTPPSADLAVLNRLLARRPVIRQLVLAPHEFRLDLAGTRADWPQILAETAASGAELLTRHEPRRLRVCANPGCRFVFYDTTRNRSRRWCSSRICGNLARVRRFRARQRSRAT